MSCLLTSGRTEPCKNSVGGLKAVYFIDYGTLGNVSFVSGTSAEIDTVSGTPTAYKYDLKGTSSFE